MGFEFPLLAWLRGPLRERALELLNGPTAFKLFAQGFLKRCSQAVRNERKAPPGLWAIVMLLAWVEHFQVQPV